MSPQVAAVIARCLQRDPADRYPNALALIHDLDHLDEVDTAILDKAPPAAITSFWHSDIFHGLMIALVLIVVIVILALLGQGAAR